MSREIDGKFPYFDHGRVAGVVYVWSPSSVGTYLQGLIGYIYILL